MLYTCAGEWIASSFGTYMQTTQTFKVFYLEGKCREGRGEKNEQVPFKLQLYNFNRCQWL